MAHMIEAFVVGFVILGGFTMACLLVAKLLDSTGYQDLPSGTVVLITAVLLGFILLVGSIALKVLR